jgi:hypothetical protein
MSYLMGKDKLNSLCGKIPLSRGDNSLYRFLFTSEEHL